MGTADHAPADGATARGTMGPADGPPAVALRELGRAYGDRVALAGVTLELPGKATLAVFGANGAGKTTLLRVLATLLRPHAGTAAVLGRTLPNESWAVRGRVGLVAHEPLLYRELSARENLRFHCRLHGVPDGRAEELLEAVGMARRADEPLRSLSRGMAQRVAICRAVLHEPELLLLDEPLANLDPGAAGAVAPLIGRASGAARVLISHDAEHALAEADLVLGLRGGRPELLAPAGDVGPGDVRGLYR
jgi:heme exporter protein A